MSEFKSCDKCKHDSKLMEEYPCCKCTHNGAADFYEEKTNADRIRAMTDKELAEFLISFKNTFGEEYEGVMSCMDWLQLEVEE